MIKHVVMWKFKAEAEGKSRAENAQWMKEKLEALVGVVPEIGSMEVGVTMKESETGYDAVLISTFENKEALETYKAHPEHQKISAYCKKIRESRVAVDYII